MNQKDNLKINSPTIFVIFGATGDLSQREIIPSLYTLYKEGILPDNFYIVGSSRKKLSVKEFRIFVEKIISKYGNKNKLLLKRFVSCISYHQGLLDNLNDFKSLNKTLKPIEEKIGQCTNKLFYLAIPPSFFKTVFQNLHDSQLTKACNEKDGWTRVLVEKPFGKDTKTAQDLDMKLGELFKEEQIFRIDHYLAKETVQNILAFRFSNLIFEPIWNKKYIESINIKMAESFDIRERGAFYDNIGALRDVGQNHILQMLALITMDNPGNINAKLIRQEREKVLLKLENINKNKIKKNVVRAQYRGYKKSKDIKKNSQTETYFKIKAFIKNNRWQGVPFYLESGKALNETKTEINIHFKKITPCFCANVHKEHVHKNELTFKIKPEEGINIRLWSKKPGLGTDIEHRDFSFAYRKEMQSQHDAYKKVLLDCMRGDQTLFASTREVEASWKFITPIIDNWQKLKLYEYKKGSMGPLVKL